MKKLIMLIIICALNGCTKKLDLKPDSTLVVPRTVEDFENLLDNTVVMNLTPAITQVSADEYYIPSLVNFNSIVEPVTRSAYIWKADIYDGQIQVRDWTTPYARIFYCNSIIDELAKQNISDDISKNRIKGWALFCRAYAYYNLASAFSKAYEAQSASIDLGIPLKTTSGVTELVKRSTVQETYDQIIKDALDASEMLQPNIITDKKNRPSKVASFALLARIYLSMRKYSEAETYADKALQLYSKLTDYNTLPIKTSSSFTYNSEETIYFSQQITDYGETSYSAGSVASLDTALLHTYEISDLRKTVWFRQNANGNWFIKGINNIGRRPFTGLATDELYLIKAECLARRNQTLASMDFLNQLVSTRWDPNATIPPKTYQNITATGPADALNKILLERRKELIYRSVRWTDLKRLNLEGQNIIITRNLGGSVYTLQPNSDKYVLPIPDDEIALSGIQQNLR